MSAVANRSAVAAVTADSARNSSHQAGEAVATVTAIATRRCRVTRATTDTN
jgi:hypothetical protein